MMLRNTQQLKFIKEDGYEIAVPMLQLYYHDNQTNQNINQCFRDGLVKSIDVENFDVFLSNTNSKNKRIYSRVFLYLLHSCIEKSAIFVIEEKEHSLRKIAKEIGVYVMSVDEFIEKIIRNEDYKKFLIQMKEDIIKIRS